MKFELFKKMKKSVIEEEQYDDDDEDDDSDEFQNDNLGGVEAVLSKE